MAARASEMAVGFGRSLRGAGLDVPVGSTITFAEALAAVGLDHRERVYWSGRATLVRKVEDVPTYDRVFAAWWLGQTPPPPPPRDELHLTLAVDADDEGTGDNDGGDQPGDDPSLTLRFSAHEMLRHKDFAQCSPAELDEARRLMGTWQLVAQHRPSRRQVRTNHRRGRPDLRRTMRAALRSGGEPIDHHHTRRGTRQRRLVLLLDVSGSMEPYARALARFAHAAVVGRRSVEVFALGTRLTRLTRELSSRDLDRALRTAADAVVDWAGGTRLGDGMQAFMDEWGQRGTARGAIVVICSDGWDRGDPAVLAAAMARLQRVAHQVVWVNPLKASEGYAPLARGMAAALPYIDHFLEGHSLDSLERLAGVIAGEVGR